MAINNKKRRFLITVDHYSDFFEIDELKELSSKAAIEICKRNFSRHGIPNVCVSDGATNFTSDEFKRFAKEWEFEIIHSSPHHQQGNGKAEAAVKIAKTIIKKAIDSGRDFYMALLQWRNTPNTIDYSPAQRMFSRKTRCNIPCMPNALQPKVPVDVKEKIWANREKTEAQYDKRSANLPTLKPDDKVMAKIDPNAPIWQKAEVKEELKPISFIITTSKNAQYRRSRVHLKPIPPVQEEPASTTTNEVQEPKCTSDPIPEPTANAQPVANSSPSAPQMLDHSLQDESETDHDDLQHNPQPIGTPSRPSRSRKRPDFYGIFAGPNPFRRNNHQSKPARVGKTRRNTHM